MPYNNNRQRHFIVCCKQAWPEQCLGTVSFFSTTFCNFCSITLIILLISQRKAPDSLNKTCLNMECYMLLCFVIWRTRPYSNFIQVILLFSVILHVICSITSNINILTYPMTLPTYLAFLTFMKHCLYFTLYRSEHNKSMKMVSNDHVHKTSTSSWNGLYRVTSSVQGHNSPNLPVDE